MESTYGNLSNTTSNASNFTAEDFVSGYIALGVAHLLVVVLPCAIFAPMLLAVLLKDKASRRDPVVIALVCTVLPSLVGPLGFGWLLDLSLITNKPFFGNCVSHRVFILDCANFTGLPNTNPWCAVCHTVHLSQTWNQS